MANRLGSVITAYTLLVMPPRRKFVAVQAVTSQVGT